MKTVKEPAKELPVVIEADVVVIGGGPAGVGAAVRAARAGAKTYLIERFGSLGGTMTNGYVACVRKFGPLAMELMERLEAGGWSCESMADWPDQLLSHICHNGKQSLNEPTKYRGPEALHWYFVNFDPDMMACVMNDVCEEAGVNLSFRNSFVDCIVENGSIQYVVVENPGGRQAIKGKVFIDCSGRGDVVARSGSPYRSQGAEDGWGFMAPGLMYKMSNVDIAKVFDYERRDPQLQVAMEKARVWNECPHYHKKQTPEQMKALGTYYNGWHTGHPSLEMMPWLYPGDLMLWSIPPYEMKLNPCESVEDATNVEIQSRKEIRDEIKFLKKYVPGFENANLAGISPMCGLREGRHPLGEYIYQWEDLINGRKFDDCVMRMTPHPSKGNIVVHSEKDAPTKKLVSLEFPKGVFLASGVDNLVLAGDNMSIDWRIYAQLKGFGQAMSTGEVAGLMAAEAVKDQVKVKNVEMDPYIVDFRYHPENRDYHLDVED